MAQGSLKKDRALFLLFLFTVFFLFSCSRDEPIEVPRNMILFIGDGMGEAQVIAGSYFGTGIEEGLSFQQFPVRGRVTTFSADNDITDSAAAATAMATGRKVNNGVLSVAIPGDGKPLETILEQSMRRGKGGGSCNYYLQYPCNASRIPIASTVPNRCSCNRSGYPVWVPSNSTIRRWR